MLADELGDRQWLVADDFGESCRVRRDGGRATLSHQRTHGRDVLSHGSVDHARRTPRHAFQRGLPVVSRDGSEFDDAAGGSPYERALDTTDAIPRNRLLAIFEPMPTGRFRGCPFHNAAVESAGELTVVDDLVRDHKLKFVERLTTVAAAAGATDPSRLGHQLAVLFDGGNALATSLMIRPRWCTPVRRPKR